MVGSEEFQIWCDGELQDWQVRVNEIEIGAKARADEPGAFQIEIVFDPNQRVEQACNTWKGQNEKQRDGNGRRLIAALVRERQ